jgi:ABC-type antimicrobial peptide transport system permease subunit
VKRFLTYVATLIYLFGIVGFLWNFSLGMFGVKINGEMPLFDIQRIEETNNRIYVGLGAYKRVQVYDLKGNYLKFIPVRGAYQSYFFFVDEHEQLDVPKVYPAVADRLNDLFIEESDYQITSYFPLVISKKQNGKSTEVIRQTWRYLFAPVSSLLVAGLGGVLVFALNLITIMDVMNLPGNRREKRNEFFKRVYGRRTIPN